MKIKPVSEALEVPFTKCSFFFMIYCMHGCSESDMSIATRAQYTERRESATSNVEP